MSVPFEPSCQTPSLSCRASDSPWLTLLKTAQRLSTSCCGRGNERAASEICPQQVLTAWPKKRGLSALISGRSGGPWAGWSVLVEPDTDQTWVESIEPDSLHGSPGSTVAEKVFDGLQQRLDQDPKQMWLVGLSYDLGRQLEAQAATPRLDNPKPTWPLLVMQPVRLALIYEHASRTWWGVHFLSDRSGRAPQEELTYLWEQLFDQIKVNLTTQSDCKSHFSCESLTSTVQASEYQKRVQQIKQYIADGDIFQVNLTRQLFGQAQGCPRQLLTKWLERHPAWYAGMLDFVDLNTNQRRAVITGSPELFLQRYQDRLLTRPIKGTRPAHLTPDDLSESDKDAAELNMIVDLMRNDLGRVCRYGSVRVTQPRTVESHPTVHHGVATVQGRLNQDCDWADVLKATMPGGSITGAPKVRAMQIIDELEGTGRGLYCGAIGWITQDAGVLNMAIRTACLTQLDATTDPSSDWVKWQLNYGVGGGVVADSDPHAEWLETIDKAQALYDVLGLSN